MEPQAHALRTCSYGPLCHLLQKYGSDKHSRHRYCDLYERYLPPRDRAFRLVEAGVQNGCSLRAWEDYFPNADVVGIDIDPACAGLQFRRARVLLGDSGSGIWGGEALGSKELPIDVVIDDGGHKGDAIIHMHRHFWPRLASGGLYVIEDLETAYYPWFGGGEVGTEGTSVALLKGLLDQVQSPYSNRPAPERPASVHVYPNIAFLVKP